MSKRDLSPDRLEAQADALLAAADSHGYSGRDPDAGEEQPFR